MKDIKFEDVQELLDSGNDPEEIFDRVSNEYYGFKIVMLNDKFNYLDENNKLLSSDLWFDDCEPMNYYGVAGIYLNNKYNRIRSDGELVFDKWHAKPDRTLLIKSEPTLY